MKRALSATLVAVLSSGILLGGCSHAQVVASSGTPPPAPVPSGGVVTSGPAGLHVGASGGGLTAAIFAAVFLAAAANWSREDHPFPDPSSLVSPAPPPAPALARERRVREQDCTQPIADPYANLKCR